MRTPIAPVLVAAAVLAGCGGTSTKYFASPRQAVPQIAEMLRKEDFKTLAAYYDLRGSQIDRAELESGQFFIRTQRPRGSHPAFWRYKHPFAPGFRYADDAPTRHAGVHRVTVSVTIDQGAGSPPQRGFDEFYMRRSSRGWQVLPEAPK